MIIFPNNIGGCTITLPFIYLQIRGRRWDAHEEVGFCSESVKIVFHAICRTSNMLGAKAEAVQKRSVMRHIAELVSLSMDRFG